MNIADIVLQSGLLENPLVAHRESRYEVLAAQERKQRQLSLRLVHGGSYA